MSESIWIGRVERKMKRKAWVELSLAVENVERTQTIYVPKNDPTVSVQHPTCLQLQALIKTRVVPRPGTSDNRTWDAVELELLECPSDPLAVKAVLKEPALWKTLELYDLSESPETTPPEDDVPKENYSQANHAMIKRIVMRLQGRKATQPRIRPPHVSFKVMQELEELEKEVDLVDIQVSTPTPEEMEGEHGTALAATGWNLPQTNDGRVLKSGRHKLTRQEYLESKKHPQIAWMRQRLKRFTETKPIRHIVDVGGGRGDLAIELALGLGPDTHVSVVDLNDPSLQAGKRYAEECGVGDRMSWICQDFNDFVETEGSTQVEVDMVVALHACGNLSDLALDYATRNQASFLICPCCYSKMEHQNAATKLAEISERPDLSRRGMHIVNSNRYWDLVASNSYSILLEEYSRAWSSRNMVLVGWPNVSD